MPRKTREKEKIIRRISFFSLINVVFLVDRILKIIVSFSYPEGGGFPVIPGIFHITVVHNTGAAFGILKGQPLLLMIISAAVVSAFLFILRHHSAAWALVIGGSLGNLADRLFFGYVIDFLDFRVWPVFNAADACICVGVACILWSFFKNARHSS